MDGEVAAGDDGRLTSLWGTTQDVTERKQVENALRQSEERNRELIENANDTIYTQDLSGKFTSLNRAGQRVTGYTLAEALQLNIADVVVPEYVDLVRQRFLRNLEGVAQPNIELEIVAKDGHRVTLDISSRVIRKDNVAVGVQGIGRDISERRRAEKEREAVSEVIQSVSLTSNVKSLFKNVHQSINKVVDARNCFVALYDDATGFFEMEFFVDQYDQSPPPQALVKSRTDYIFRTGQPMVMTQEIFQRLVREGELADQGTLPAAWLGVPLATPTGVIGVLVVQHYTDPEAYSTRDLEFMTSVGGQVAVALERKRAEEALHESEGKLALLIERTPLAAIETNPTGEVVEWNPAAESIFGYSRNEALGRSVFELILPQGTDEDIDRLWQKNLASGKAGGATSMKM